jgi:uncharacterized membrane protein
MMSNIRKYLIAGLLVWVPLAATVLIIKLVIDLMDMTLLLFPERLHPENLWGFTIPGTGLILAVIVVFVTGVLAANLLGRKLVDVWENILGRIPLIRNVYNAFKQITHSVLSSENKSFRKVVLIEFPNQGMWSIGFLTNPDIKIESNSLDNELIAVFVSTTPNPTTGFLVMLPKNKVIELDITIEDAFKLVMSMGVIVPNSTIKDSLLAKTVAQTAAAS